MLFRSRAGKSGKAITFADEEFVYGLEAIEKYIKMKIPVIWPENLPEVEDKSLGKRWYSEPHSEHTTQRSTSKTTKGAKASSKSSKVASKTETKSSSSKATSSKPASKPSSKPASKPKTKSLGSMTEEERIAYYKAKYGFVPTAAAEAKAKADDSAKPEAKGADKAESSKSSTKPESKLTKFFKKLFGRNK